MKRGLYYARLLACAALSSMAFCMLFAWNANAKPIDDIGSDFDIANFYVCDEFLEKGTSGGDITEESMDALPDIDEIIQGDVWPETIESNVDAVVQPLHMSAEGIAMLEGFEGLRLTAYKALSTETYYTIGYGHYGPDVKEGMTITQAQAEELLRQDLASRENYLNTFASSNGILFRQNEFDAILSLIFNIGTGNFSDSTIRRYILEGFENHTDEDYVTAIGMWRKSGGQVVQGLVNRRAKESAYFTRYGVKRPQMREASLGLNGRVGLNIYMYIPEKITQAPGAYVLNVTSKGPQNLYLSDISHEGQLYCISNSFPPREINTTVAIALVDASGVMYPIINSNTTDGFTYVHSLEKFRSSALAAGRNDLVKLSETMNEYGNCTWAYFNSKAYAPTGEITGVTGQDFAKYAMELSGTLDGIEYVGTSLVLQSGTAIKHYFSINNGYSASDFRFEIREDESGIPVLIQPSCNEGIIAITIDNISPIDYEKEFIVEVKGMKSQDNSAIRIKYGVLSYGDKLFNSNGNELLKNVLRAMYLYGKAAKGCF